MRMVPPSHRKGRHTLSLLMAVFLVFSCFAARNSTTDKVPETHKDAQQDTTSADTTKLRLIIEKYAESVDKADVALASEIWWNSPMVSFIHPLGHEHGFEQIKENVYRHLMGDTFSERKLTIRDVSLHVHKDVAWAEFHWDFVAKLRKDGSTITTHGRETQIYRKLEGTWRLVHVHYSGVPGGNR